MVNTSFVSSVQFNSIHVYANKFALLLCVIISNNNDSVVCQYLARYLLSKYVLKNEIISYKIILIEPHVVSVFEFIAYFPQTPLARLPITTVIINFYTLESV